MQAATDPFAETVIYQSLGYCLPTGLPTPIFRHDWEALLAQARQAVDRRVAAYPEMIRTGVIASDVAARDIAAWQQIVAEWQWIITAQGALPPAESLPARRAAVELAAERIELELKRGKRTLAILEQQQLVMALQWHLAELKHGAPAIHFWAELNHRMHGRIAACPSCDRRADSPDVRSCTRADCGLPDRQQPDHHHAAIPALFSQSTAA